MGKLYNIVKWLSIIGMIMVFVVLMPALTYSNSAKKAEELIIYLIDENAKIVTQTASVVERKLELDVTEETLENFIFRLLIAESKSDMLSQIKREIRTYRLSVSLEDQNRFIEYMDEKRLYFQENNDTIQTYRKEYESELNSLPSGFFMRIAGYPDKLVLE